MQEHLCLCRSEHVRQILGSNYFSLGDQVSCTAASRGCLFVSRLRTEDLDSYSFPGWPSLATQSDFRKQVHM